MSLRFVNVPRLVRSLNHSSSQSDFDNLDDTSENRKVSLVCSVETRTVKLSYVFIVFPCVKLKVSEMLSLCRSLSQVEMGVVSLDF